jgi:hypothetical protein
MKPIIFIIIWISFCLLLEGKIIPHLNDNVDYQDQYCGTGMMPC